MDIDDENGGGRLVQWIQKHGNFHGSPDTVQGLPPAIYKAIETDDGTALQKIKFPSDSLSRLPGLPINYILGQIKDFWDRAKVFEDLGLVHKRGILLYGPAGCGKTSIIRLLCDDIIERNGVVLDITHIPTGLSALQLTRQIEPNRPVMTIIEDIDDYLADSDNDPSPQLLSMLDGELQINHVVHLATTNNPEKLEDRIIRRPGRFDLVIGLNYPIREARDAYLKSYLSNLMPNETIERLVDATDGFGLAHLRELVVSHYCLGVDLDETLKRLKTGIKATHKVKKNQQEGMGFTVNFASAKEAA